MDEKFSTPLWAPELLAEYLDLSKSHLSTLRQSGGGPPFIKISNGRQSKVRYRREAVFKWLEDNEFRSTADYSRRSEEIQVQP